MQIQTLCRAVEISITTSYSTSVKLFYGGLTEVFITSPFCDHVYEGQVKDRQLRQRSRGKEGNIHTYIHTTLFVLAGYKKRQHMLMWTCLKLI